MQEQNNHTKLAIGVIVVTTNTHDSRPTFKPIPIQSEVWILFGGGAEEREAIF